MVDSRLVAKIRKKSRFLLRAVPKTYLAEDLTQQAVLMILEGKRSEQHLSATIIDALRNLTSQAMGGTYSRQGYEYKTVSLEKAMSIEAPSSIESELDFYNLMKNFNLLTRLIVVLEMQEGYQLSEIARWLGVSQSLITRWKQAEGLRTHTNMGKHVGSGKGKSRDAASKFPPHPSKSKLRA